MPTMIAPTISKPMKTFTYVMRVRRDSTGRPCNEERLATTKTNCGTRVRQLAEAVANELVSRPRARDPVVERFAGKKFAAAVQNSVVFADRRTISAHFARCRRDRSVQLRRSRLRRGHDHAASTAHQRAMNCSC